MIQQECQVQIFHNARTITVIEKSTSIKTSPHAGMRGFTINQVTWDALAFSSVPWMVPVISTWPAPSLGLIAWMCSAFDTYRTSKIIPEKNWHRYWVVIAIVLCRGQNPGPCPIHNLTKRPSWSYTQDSPVPCDAERYLTSPGKCLLCSYPQTKLERETNLPLTTQHSPKTKCSLRAPERTCSFREKHPRQGNACNSQAQAIIAELLLFQHEKSCGQTKNKES